MGAELRGRSEPLRCYITYCLEATPGSLKSKMTSPLGVSPRAVPLVLQQVGHADEGPRRAGAAGGARAPGLRGRRGRLGGAHRRPGRWRGTQRGGAGGAGAEGAADAVHHIFR